MIAFYSGELMSPEAIRAADPEARFIARGKVTINPGEAPDVFADALDEEVWGIAVETSAQTEPAEVTITLDNGSSLIGALAEPLLNGNDKAVLANARYWELPPAYIACLRSVVERGLDEE